MRISTMVTWLLHCNLLQLLPYVLIFLPHLLEATPLTRREASTGLEGTFSHHRHLLDEPGETFRSQEINRRFVRHLRSLIYGSTRRSAAESAPLEGASWARELVCEPGCLHGGICQLDAKRKEPACLCPLPDPTSGVYFRGSSCQTQAVRCNSTFWCENGGTCSRVPNSPPGEESYSCSCAPKFQGSKCQTPVTRCGSGDDDLWCANGGECVYSEEADATICKCPSTHAGTNCQKMVEPQDLGPVHHSLSNFTSPLVIPPASDVVLLQEEQQHYFKAFFLIFGVFLTIWVTALAAVHCPRPRHELKRRIAALRGELTPLKQEKKRLGRSPTAENTVVVVERLPSSNSAACCEQLQGSTGLSGESVALGGSVSSSDASRLIQDLHTSGYSQDAGLPITPDASDRLTALDSVTSAQGAAVEDLETGLQPFRQPSEGHAALGSVGSGAGALPLL